MVALQLDIVNVVASAWVGNLDIEMIAKSFPRSLYDPSIFSGLVYHRQVPKATVIMFSTGRIVSTGTRSTVKAKESLNVTTYEINKILKKSMILQKIKTENIVARGVIPNKIDLKKLAREYRKSSYNPSSFPAVICINKPYPSCLVFSTGKIISAGAKNESQARKSIKDMFRMIDNLDCHLK